MKMATSKIKSTYQELVYEMMKNSLGLRRLQGLQTYLHHVCIILLDHYFVTTISTLNGGYLGSYCTE
jgi:hypothetical protein